MGKCLKFCICIVSLTVLSVGILIGLLLSAEEVFYRKASIREVNFETEMSHYIEPEKDYSLNVLDNNNGQLNNVGWTTEERLFSDEFKSIQPSTTVDISFVKDFINNHRLKKWEVYNFFSEDYAGAISIFDLEYLGGIMFHISKINHGKNTENLPENSGSNNMTFPIVFEYMNPFFHPVINNLNFTKNVIVNNGLPQELYSQFFNTSTSEVKKLLFQRTTKKNHYISFSFQKGNFSLDFDVSLRGQDKEAMVTFNPINEDKSLFYYCVKAYNLIPSGTITINNEKISLKHTSFMYDQGRGVWPLKSGWIWIGASGITVEGEEFGFNAGHGFTHPTAKFTEDSFFVNGKLYKLYNIKYKKSEKKNEHGLYNWKFYDEEVRQNANLKRNSCELEFIVTSLKDSVTRVLIADIIFNIHYGYYEGVCTDDKGNKYKLSHVTGLLEEKMSLW